MSLIIDGTSGVTFNDSSLQGSAASPYTFKNYLINGNLDIWQRGTSFTSSGYGADRWYLTVTGTATHIQETSGVPTGSRYAIKWTTGAGSSFGQTRQLIETNTVKQIAGKVMTFSFLAKVSAGYVGNIQHEIYYSTTTDTLSGFSGLAISCTTSGTINSSTASSSYVKYTATFTVPSNAVGLYIGIVPDTVQPTGQSCSLAQMQLELGSYATQLEYRPISTELANCQRYYYRVSGAAGTPFGAGYVKTTSTALIRTEFPVTMRTSPSALEQSGTAGNYRVNNLNTATQCTSIPTFADGSLYATATNLTTGATLTAGNGCIGAFDTTSYLAWSAEL